MDDNTPKNYQDYYYFSHQEAINFVMDVVKLFVESRHQTAIAFDDYIKLIKGFKKYCTDKEILLMTNSLDATYLLNTDSVMIDDYVKSIMNMECVVENSDNNSFFIIPDQLVSDIQKDYYYAYFEEESNRDECRIKLNHYLMVRLLQFDINEIKKVYSGEYIYAENTAPKFYLNTLSGTPNSESITEFVTKNIIANNQENKHYLWDVYSLTTDKNVALIYLEIDKENQIGIVDVICCHNHYDTNLGEALKLVKDICLKKFELKKVIATNRNNGFSYSSINTLFYFAGFKAKYYTDHTDFEAVQDFILTVDEIYNHNQKALDKIVLD